MAESKDTSRDWRPTEYYDGVVAVDRLGKVIGWVCAMHGKTGMYYQYHEHADLIAAAPALLDACEAVLVYLDFVMANAEELSTAIVLGATTNGQRIEAAIAKARMES